MPNWVYPPLIGGVIGLILGYFVARKSAAEKPIRGGTVANIFHYLGAAAFVSVAPTVLIAAMIFRLGFARDLILAIGLLAISAVCLLIHAAIEVQSQPATSK